jgi:hypothetical protein
LEIKKTNSFWKHFTQFVGATLLSLILLFMGDEKQLIVTATQISVVQQIPPIQAKIRKSLDMVTTLSEGFTINYLPWEWLQLLKYDIYAFMALSGLTDHNVHRPP